MIKNLRATYDEFPRQFWLIMVATLIDLMGLFLIFPFFSLYFTEKFGVSLTKAGLIYAIWAVAGMGGHILGGALADRFGRKYIVVAGMIFSALSSVALALAPNFTWVYITAAIGGLLSRSAGPAQSAMIADLLPEEKLTEGYAIWRVVSNVAFAIGPAIGGLFAGISFALLFYIDAATSIITAIFIALTLRETQSHSAAQKTSRQSFTQVFSGYTQVLKDHTLLILIVLSGLVGLVYWQWYFSVPVFMRDVHNMPSQVYGAMMSISGMIVVFIQLPLTRKLRPYSQWLIMAIGCLLFGIGFGLFAFVSGYILFMFAFVIITFGEMIIFPTRDAIVAQLAPEELRGRYMAAAAFGFSIPNMIAPTLGGLLLDSADPNLLWYLAGIFSAAGAAGYIVLYTRSTSRDNPPDNK